VLFRLRYMVIFRDSLLDSNFKWVQLRFMRNDAHCLPDLQLLYTVRNKRPYLRKQLRSENRKTAE